MRSVHPLQRVQAETSPNPETSGGAPVLPAIGTTDDDDAADLAAARAGEEQAFGRLYDRHAAVVMSLCRRFTPSEAEDSLQETFLRAHRMLHKVHDAAGLRTWLYAIARRVCSERSRAAQRRRRHEEARAVTAERAQLGELPTAGECAERSEELRRLDAALDRLDDRERLAIHLHYLEADPVRAAAAALGLTRSGYYKLLGRARARLADLISSSDTKP